MHCKSVVIEKPFQAAFRDIELTPKREDTVVCQTTMSGISCGTDMITYRGWQSPESLTYPCVPGYENVGVILEEGSYAPGLKKGDRVMINETRVFGNICGGWGGGTHIAYKDSVNCFGAGDPLCKIPDNVSDRDATLAYLGCVSLKGVEQFEFQPNDIVAVFGSGMIGVSAMQLIRIKCPTAKIICIEPNEFRRSIAKFYADHVIDFGEAGLKEFMDITNGHKADKIMECSGNWEVPGILYKYIKDGGWMDDDPAGHIHLQGMYAKPMVVENYHRWFGTNCKITMTCAMKARGKAEILGYMADGRYDTSHLPVEIWPVEKCAEAYEYLQQKGPEVFKILFDWSNVKL